MARASDHRAAQDGGRSDAPTIIWHCGLQKTATSTIQALLKENLEALAPHAVILPRGFSTRALRDAANALWAEDSLGNATRLKKAVAEIAAGVVASGKARALVSDENILGEFLAGNGRDLFSFAAEVFPLVAEAAQPAHSVFVLYTRDVESWLRSAHNQVVKERRVTLDFDDWRAEIPFADDLPAAFERLVRGTGLDIRTVALEDETADCGWPGRRLLELCAIPEDVLTDVAPPPTRRNQSLSQGALQFMLQINRSPLANRQVQLVRRIVRNNQDLFAREAKR